VPSIKQVYLPKNQKEYEQFVRTPFHTSCRARYSVLHLLGVLSGGKEPPLCKGRWLAERDGGIVIKQDFIVKQSLSRLRRQLPLHKGAFGLRASKVHLLFLTSTAFVDTKAQLAFKIHIYSFEQLLLTVIVLGHSLCQFQSSFAVVCCCCGTAQIENGHVSVFLNRTFCDNILTKLI